MKREFLWLTTALMLFFALESCRHSETVEPLEQEEEEEIDYLTEDSLKRLVRGFWRLEQFLLVKGADTLDLEEIGVDHLLFPQRKHVIFDFQEYNVVIALAPNIKDTQERFKKPAELHVFPTRTMQPAVPLPRWDEEQKTMVIKSNGGGLLHLPAGNAYLVKSKLVKYKNWKEEEAATVPSCQMYRVETNEGTYLFVLRQAHYYENAPIITSESIYVVFP